MSLFLSNHELQSFMICPDSWSIFISIFCTFSILACQLKVWAFLGSSIHTALPWYMTELSGVGLPAVSARTWDVIELHVFKSTSMIMQMLCLPCLLARTALHHWPAPRKYIPLFLKIHLNELQCLSPFFSSSVT